MSKRIVLLALGVVACRPQRSEPARPPARAPTTAPAPAEAPTIPPGTALFVTPGATVWLDRGDARPLQLPDRLASGGLAVRVIGSVGDRIEVETDADSACTLQPLRELRLRIFVARADLRDGPAPCVEAPRDADAQAGVLTAAAAPQATRIVRAGTTVYWRDDEPAGAVARDYTFAAPPSVAGMRVCFPFALAPGDELTLCFPSDAVAEVRTPEVRTPNMLGDSSPGLGTSGLRGLADGEGLGAAGLGARSGEAGFGSSKLVPHVRLAPPAVAGPLDRDIVRRVARSHLDELRFCYVAALARDPKTRGKVEIRFTIDGHGEVDDAIPESSTVADAELLTCMIGRVNRWRFPEPRGAGTVKVTYPLVLELK